MECILLSDDQARLNFKIVKAAWNGFILAESPRTIVLEGNYYFPPVSVNFHHLRPSSTVTRCPWKGLARYYTVIARGSENIDAAWCYDNPVPEADHIKGYVAFWKGVTVY